MACIELGGLLARLSILPRDTADTTTEDFVLPLLPVPYNHAVTSALEVLDAVLWDELLVRLLCLPRVQGLLHGAGEAILVAHDEVSAVEGWVL